MRIFQMLIQLYRLSFALQSMALESSFGFSGSKRIAIHNLVAKYLNFSSQLMAIPSLCQHVQQVRVLLFVVDSKLASDISISRHSLVHFDNRYWVLANWFCLNYELSGKRFQE